MALSGRSLLESALRGPILLGALALTLLPLLVMPSLVYPEITGKGLALRGAVSVLFFAWVALALARPDYRPRWSPVTIALAGWLGVAGIANLAGVDPYRSLWGTPARMDGYLTLLHVCALVLVVGSAVRPGREWRRVLALSVAVSSGIAVAACAEFLFHQAIGDTAHRAEATLGNATFLGAYLLVHLFLAAHLVASYRWSRISDVLLGLSIVVHLAALLATGTRGAVFGTAAGVAVALMLIGLSRLSRRARILTLAASVAVALTIAVGAGRQLESWMPDHGAAEGARSPVQQAGDLVLPQQRPLGQLQRLVGEQARLGNGLNTRLVAWSVALDAIRERPWLGWGQESFEIAVERHYDPRLEYERVWDRPHNAVLEWAVNAGVPGAIAYVVVWLAALLAVLDFGRRGRPVGAALLAGLFVAYGVSNLFLFDTISTYLAMGLVLGYLHAHWTAVRMISAPRQQPRPRLAAVLVVPLAVAAALVVTTLTWPSYQAMRLWRDAAPMTDLEWDEKFAALETALALDTFIDEELRRAYLELASLAYGRQLPEADRQSYVAAARDHMQELIAAAPQRSRHREDLGRFLAGVGEPEEGLAQLLAAMKQVPDRPALRLEVATVLERLGRAEEALAFARVAHELEPRHSWPLIYYSGMAHSHGQTDLAVSLLAPAATDLAPGATLSALLPEEVGGATDQDRRWLVALLDFDARQEEAGRTSWKLVELGAALPRLRNAGAMSRAAVRVESEAYALRRQAASDTGN